MGLADQIAHGIGRGVNTVATSKYSTIADRAREGFLQFDPITLPDPYAILRAANCGDLNWGTARSALRLHGVLFENGGFLSDHKKRFETWKGVYDSIRERPGLSAIFTALFKGMIDENEAQKLLKKTGADAKSFNNLIHLFHAPISEFEVTQLRNRDIISDQQFNTLMKLAGGYTVTQLEYKDKLREVIPGPSDLTRFALKDVFDYANIRKRGWLSDPTPPAFKEWMRKQGFHGKVNIIDSDNGGSVELEWADLFWAAHWQVITPTQIYTFLQRFRQAGGGGNQTRFGVKPFTQKDANDWLKIDDYPPEVREWLKAAAYRLPGLRQIEALYRYKVVPLKEVGELYQDIGYSPNSANVLMQLADKREKDRQAKEARPQAIAAIIANYRSGAVTRDQASNALHGLGLEDNEVSIRLDSVDWQINNDVVVAAIKSIRTAFMLGVWGGNQALSLLVEAGVTTVRAQKYIALWQAQFTLPRKQLVTQKVLQLRREGLMSRQEAVFRLTNLGWQSPESVLLMAENDLNILRDQIKEKEKQDRDARRQEQQKHADAKQSATPAMLRKYFLDDLIDVATLFQRLQDLGWPVGDILLFIADAQKEKGS